MNLNILQRSLARDDLEIQFLGYYGTFGFWLSYEGQSRKKTVLSRLLLLLLSFFQGLLSRLRINAPNRFFSPHIVCVAKKVTT
jgi:hypothetical protein